MEKGSLHNTVYPELRAHCRTKGYELHIVDLHWKTLLEKQQDHEFPELCIGELTSKANQFLLFTFLFLCLLTEFIFNGYSSYLFFFRTNGNCLRHTGFIFKQFFRYAIITNYN